MESPAQPQPAGASPPFHPGYAAYPAPFPMAVPRPEAWYSWARNAVLGIALVALAAAVFLAFAAVNDIIAAWLEPRWAPVWRAIFASGVIVLSLHVLSRLTGRRLLEGAGAGAREK